MRCSIGTNLAYLVNLCSNSCHTYRVATRLRVYKGGILWSWHSFIVLLEDYDMNSFQNKIFFPWCWLDYVLQCKCRSYTLEQLFMMLSLASALVRLLILVTFFHNATKIIWIVVLSTFLYSLSYDIFYQPTLSIHLNTS